MGPRHTQWHSSWRLARPLAVRHQLAAGMLRGRLRLPVGSKCTLAALSGRACAQRPATSLGFIARPKSEAMRAGRYARRTVPETLVRWRADLHPEVQIARGADRYVAYASSVTQPSDADLTHLMYLKRVPWVAFSGGAFQVCIALSSVRKPLTRLALW